MTPPPRTDARMTRLPVSRRFLAALAGGPLDTRPDAELLDRFARYGERPALEAVVRRHAALVRGVCRRLLGPTADADDAFQATFLVLLRHVGRGRPPAKVGPWLYSVAVRTAARLRSRRRFAPLPEVPAPETPAADWLPLLDQALAGLPAKYRDALVLCELQGASRREAARTLGIAEGTLSSRLSRGRELLRRRLLKHGTLLPAVGLGVTAEAAPAEVVAATVALADGAVPAAVTAAVPPAGWGVWKLAACVGLLAAVGGGLAVVPGDEPQGADKPAKPAAIVAKQPSTAAEPGKPSVPDQQAFQGLWLFEDLRLTDAGKQKVLAESNTTADKLEAELAAARKWGRLVVHGERLWVILGGSPDASTFAIRPDRLPKLIDLRRRPEGTARLGSEPFKGVYAFDGDRLTLALGDPGGPRPADVEPGETAFRTMIFRKGPPPDPTTATAAKPLLGRWELVSGTTNLAGDRKPEAMSRGWLEVTPDAVFLRYGYARNGKDHFDSPNGPVIQAATYTLDPTRRHPWIDLQMLTDTDVGNAGDVKRYGVYEVSGDTLRLVLGEDRAFRPLDFTVEPDTTPADRKGPNPLRGECFEFRRAKP